jgi:hypothetical protein
MSKPSSNADCTRQKEANYRKETKVNLYEVTPFLHETPRKELGVYLPYLYIYVQDPLIAERNKALGINPVEVLWEPGLRDGPTSARLAVVDYDIDTGVLHPPARWNEKIRSFIWWDEKKQPGPFLWNPNKSHFETQEGETLVGDHLNMPQFHQVNAWAAVQSILKIFESPDVMGRRIPWGVDGNRLLIVPHAGYTPNAFYNRAGKSLQLYYCGDPARPVLNCLSYDVIAHETGHAILDGIRPYYYDFTSIQTAAFHEFFADITDMLTTLRNNEVRQAAFEETEQGFEYADVITNLAEQLGEAVHSGKPIRDMTSKLRLVDIKKNNIPHDCSLVLTGAIFEILIGIWDEQLKIHPNKTRMQNLWNGAKRILHMAFQPVDFLPPVDVQFTDYARAFLHYFDLFEPPEAISPGRGVYEKLCQKAFSARGLRVKVEELKEIMFPKGNIIFHPLEEIIHSRTEAYHYLHDNRRVFQIPDKQDFKVLDSYEAHKNGREPFRLPGQFVLQYVWSEEVPLEEKRFGLLKGKTAELLCGGTLVFDPSGNILSWMHKPGTEFPDDADMVEGKKRKTALLEHLALQVKSGRVGLHGSAEMQIPGPWTPSVVECSRDGLMHLQITPAARKTYDESENAVEFPFSFDTSS